jgi:hypothetical protein
MAAHTVNVAVAGIFASSGGPDLNATTKSIQDTAMVWVRAIAIVVLIICGIMLGASLGGHEEQSKTKKAILAVIGGIALVAFAVSFVDTFFAWIGA